MRTKALILFFPFAVFMAETASFVPTIKEACAVIAAKKSACVKENKQYSCSRKKEKTFCGKPKPEKCGNKKNGKIPTEKSCSDNADCSTCPVCYTFIVQPQYEVNSPYFFFKKNYGLTNKGYTSLYTSDVWKPPNRAFFS